MNHIAQPQTVPRHTEAIITLNTLIIDLKLVMQGQQAIDAVLTVARIQELERVVDEIQACRERLVFY